MCIIPLARNRHLTFAFLYKTVLQVSIALATGEKEGLTYVVSILA